MKVIARVLLAVALLAVCVLIANADFAGEVPAQCTDKRCAALEFPMLTETAEIRVSGTFICGGEVCDSDLEVVGALRIDDLKGAHSYEIDLGATQSKVSVGMVPFSTTIQLQNLDVVWNGQPGHGTLFLAATNRKGGAITGSAYVIPSTEPDNLSPSAGLQAQLPGLVLPPYVVGLADPRPSPILVLRYD
jgi:hypothetical protein